MREKLEPLKRPLPPAPNESIEVILARETGSQDRRRKQSGELSLREAQRQGSFLYGVYGTMDRIPVALVSVATTLGVFAATDSPLALYIGGGASLGLALFEYLRRYSTTFI